MHCMTGMAVARLAVALLPLLAASRCAAGRDFYVGGREGWTANPAEPFNRWAERNRFQVNDRMVFRYSRHDDSVLVVSQSHYDACNTTEPFLRLDGGDSVFVLTNSGPYFFISGDAGRCQAGERLIVVVLAVRGTDSDGVPSSPSTPPPPPPPKSSSSSPPTSNPVPAPASPMSLPLPPPAAGNCSSPSRALAPPPVTNATASPSSAPALSGGILTSLSLVIGGAIFF